MRLALFVTLAVGVLLGCAGGGSSSNRQAVVDPMPKACPFTFAEPAALREPGDSPMLLAVPVFQTDGPEFEIQNEQGKSGLLSFQSIHPFTEDGRPNRGAHIGYIQPLIGTSVLLTPDQGPAELQRSAKNAAATMGAKTENVTLTLGQTQVHAVVQTSESSKLVTLMVPVFDGEFIAPVTVGVYTTVSGCDTTMETAFATVLAGLQLRNDNKAYETNPIVLDYVKDKRASQ